MNPQDIAFVFEVLSKCNPHPTTELISTNPYTLLVAVVLSAQATDKGVNLATKALFERVETPEEMLDLSLEELESYIKTINFYPAKARYILSLSHDLVQRHQGQVPDSREALMALAGVGRKTANVVLNTVFGHPVMAVDTHVHRVSNRLGLSHGKTPYEIEEDLMKVIPASYMQHAHHWLILHGRYTCKARTPLCEECPVARVCEYVRI